MTESVKVRWVDAKSRIDELENEVLRLTNENERLHEAENEIIGLQDALDFAKERRIEQLNEIARLREALVACDRYFKKKKSWDNRLPELIKAKQLTSVALEGEAAPQEGEDEEWRDDREYDHGPYAV